MHTVYVGISTYRIQCVQREVITTSIFCIEMKCEFSTQVRPISYSGAKTMASERLFAVRNEPDESHTTESNGV